MDDHDSIDATQGREAMRDDETRSLVLARIEAGAARDANDLLDLRDRCLELFKVTSRGGVPEIWLLGQKLLGGDSPL